MWTERQPIKSIGKPAALGWKGGSREVGGRVGSGQLKLPRGEGCASLTAWLTARDEPLPVAET
eukprot:5981861-Prymnesium_polylepis.1